MVFMLIGVDEAIRITHKVLHNTGLSIATLYLVFDEDYNII